MFKKEKKRPKLTVDLEEKYQYGFCLIRVQFAATNIAVCHFGFYQTLFEQAEEF